jgi:hypothetical protein
MCRKPKTPKALPQIIPKAAVVVAEPEPMESPEAAKATTGSTRATGRRNLRIDLGSGDGGTGLNAT